MRAVVRSFQWVLRPFAVDADDFAFAAVRDDLALLDAAFFVLVGREAARVLPGEAGFWRRPASCTAVVASVVALETAALPV